MILFFLLKSNCEFMIKKVLSSNSSRVHGFEPPPLQSLPFIQFNPMIMKIKSKGCK